MRKVNGCGLQLGKSFPETAKVAVIILIIDGGVGVHDDCED